MSKWLIAENLGYTPITTFWEDFSIADSFGKAAIHDTYKRIFKEWKADYKYLTELVMVINHKSWEHQNDPLCEVYAKLYYDAYDAAVTYLEKNKKPEALQYFFRTLD